MRVLVVDDDTLVRTEIAALLEFEGMVVVEAATGREALASVRAEPVDLVVSDWRMPGMDGLELLAAIRAGGDAAAAVPFVLLSGSGALAVSAEPRPDAVLRKPVAIDDLVGTLRRLAGRRSG